MIAIAVGLLSQSYLVASADGGEKFLTGPDRTRTEEAKPIATLNLPNGDVLDFVAVRDDREMVVGFVILSMIHRDSAGYQSIERLRDANALEVFNALSKRGTPMPRELVVLHGQAKLGPQGWGIPLLLAADPGQTHAVMCNQTATYMYWDAMDYGLSTYNQSFEAVTGPDETPAHWHDSTVGGWGFPTYDLYGQANRVTSFSTAVALCHVDSWHYHYGEPVLNWVNVRYRESGNASWGLHTAGQITDEYYVVAAELKLAGYSLPSANEFDFRLEVVGVEDSTLLRVGAAWHKKIGSVTIGE
jgi:hypothetical protein